MLAEGVEQRLLTQEESEVLAHIVVDPAAWWLHCQHAPNIDDPEAALAGKVLKWRPAYLAELLELGGDYQTRAQKEAE